MKNPKWTRDELILALDLYFRCPPSKTNKENKEIIALSDLLNSLPIHPQKLEYDKFRNPNGVYMKLCNFLRFDPNYSGTGLKVGGKLEEEIWHEFSGNKENLRRVSQAIINSSTDVPRPTGYEEDDEEFEEGRVLTRLHKIRERSPSVIKKKKADVLKKTGKLECEACGFDFHKFYGDIGQGVAECHHTRPVSELKKGDKTKLSDLSILCANCHRIIHKSKPMFSVKQLRKEIKQ
jgi:5-methylcytosine-specific restriction protein A